MSKYSRDKLAEIDAQIAHCVAIDLNISAKKISEKLGFDHAFVCRRKRKIDRQNAEEIKRMTVEEDLGGIKSFIDSVLPEITRIIFDDKTKDSDKISAFKAVLMGRMTLLDKKFQTGIFERQLNAVSAPEREKMSDAEKADLERALDYFYNPDRPIKCIADPIPLNVTVNNEFIS